MITNSKIGMGNQLGAQMSDFAYLYYIAKENDQKLVWWEELIDFRRGFQFLHVFFIPENSIIRAKNTLKFFSKVYCNLFSGQKKDWKKNYKRIYQNHFLRITDAIYLRLIKLAHKEFKTIKNIEDEKNGGGE